ncbi:hypothetical protein HRbin15_00152 [bacterium HR15]|nr:hypothetical protein HRbin15_00152 [bacterium HR15]
MDAVLIAGGLAPSELVQEAGYPRKGLFRFAGQPLVQRVVRVLQASGIGRVVVVGSELLMAHLNESPNRLLFALEGAEPIENLLRGIERLGLTDEARFLHCAVDLPMLTPHAVCDWLNALPPESDLAVGFVPNTVFERHFPGAPYKAVRFREGYFLNASLSVMRVGFLKAHAPQLQRLAHARKSLPWFTLCLASWLGVRFLTMGVPTLARFAMGRLSLQELPLLAQRAFDIRLHVYPHAMPELAFDIDTVDDYRYAQAWFRAQSRIE